MKDELVINGVTYRAVKEEKNPKRLEGWIKRSSYEEYNECKISVIKHKSYGDDTRMIEIRGGENIVSEDDVAEAWRNTFSLAPSPQQSEMFALFLKYLGFKKDGAECGK